MPLKIGRIFLVILFAVSNGFTSSPKTKTYDSQNDFIDGKMEAVAITHRGELTLSPQIKQIAETELGFIWASVADASGNIFVAGAGNKVLRINSNGEVSTIFEADEAQIYVLAIQNDGALYAGSSPNGKVYRLKPNGSDYKSSVFFEPNEMYIWAIQLNSQGEVFIATGENGKIFKVNRAGKGDLFYKCDDTHVTKLVAEKSGSFIVGTSGKALLLRVNSTGNAFVLYDSDLTEITDIHIQGELVFAAATGNSRLSRLQAGAPQGASKKDSKEAAETEEEDLEIAIQQIVPSGRGGREKGEIYKLSGNSVRIYQTLNRERVYCIAPYGKNDLLLGTGEEGKVYQMNLVGEMNLISDFDEMQITNIIHSRGQYFLTASNGGAVYKIATKTAASGEYTTEVYDATVVSKWGSIGWEAARGSGDGIKLQTRSGNTEKPDKTWSNWSNKYLLSAGQPVTSPEARFLQIKATLTAANKPPLLDKISFSHLQKNISPEVSQIYIHYPGDYYAEAVSNGFRHSLNGESGQDSDFQNQGMGRKSYKKGFQSISWIVDDPNGDGLSYALSYRAIGDKEWRKLIDKYRSIVYSWDSQMMPDGKYEARLVAKDDLSNPENVSLKAEKISDMFLIDNSAPVVKEIKFQTRNGATVISFDAEDEWSAIAEVEYSINAEDWKKLYPVDGICDTKQETFEITLNETLSAGSSIVIKTQDALQNYSFSRQKK